MRPIAGPRQGNQMHAVWFDHPNSSRLVETSLPGVERECRVRVHLAGICGTDLALMQGYAGFSGVPGHEFVGVVEAAPAADWATADSARSSDR